MIMRNSSYTMLYCLEFHRTWCKYRRTLQFTFGGYDVGGILSGNEYRYYHCGNPPEKLVAEAPNGDRGKISSGS